MKSEKKNYRGRRIQSITLKQVPIEILCNSKQNGTFLELISNMLKKLIFKIYSRTDLYYRFQILSNFEFSDSNDVLSFWSVFINYQPTDLDDISHVYHQDIIRKNVVID